MYKEYEKRALEFYDSVVLKYLEKIQELLK
jgi:hypothetical protein